MGRGSALGLMAAQEADFVCPFCGRDYEDQEALTGHFEADHDMAGFD